MDQMGLPIMFAKAVGANSTDARSGEQADFRNRPTVHNATQERRFFSLEMEDQSGLSGVRFFFFF